MRLYQGEGATEPATGQLALYTYNVHSLPPSWCNNINKEKKGKRGVIEKKGKRGVIEKEGKRGVTEKEGKRGVIEKEGKRGVIEKKG